MSDTVRQGIDIAIGAVGKSHLTSEPVFGNAAQRPHEKTVDGGHELGMIGPGNFAVVRDLAHIPQFGNSGRRIRIAGNVAIASHRFEGQHVVGHARARQPGLGWHVTQAFTQPLKS